jgi:hypothetical protein
MMERMFLTTTIRLNYTKSEAKSKKLKAKVFLWLLPEPDSLEQTARPAGLVGLFFLAINFTKPDGKPQKNKCLLWIRILLLNPVEKVLEFGL